MRLLFRLALPLFILQLSSVAHAQYQWRPVTINRVDTVFYGITSMSCSGDNCVAMQITFSPNIGDSNILLRSSDGGHTWTSADSTPQWYDFAIANESGRAHYYFFKLIQFDSVNGLAIPNNPNGVFWTHNNWKSMEHATNFPPDTNSGTLQPRMPFFHQVDFANSQEGIAAAPWGVFYLTADGGAHWTKYSTFHGATTMKSYGSGMFRIFVPGPPDLLLTTNDYWQTRTMEYLNYADILADTTFYGAGLQFLNGDSLVELGYRWRDTTAYTPALALSTDLGQHWREIPLPEAWGFAWANPQFNWDHLVIAGMDTTGRVFQSTDHGSTWRCDTVLLNGTQPVNYVDNVTFTRSGRVLASVTPQGGILTEHGIISGSSIAILEPKTLSSVAVSPLRRGADVFPNPASTTVTFPSLIGSVTISDPLGRTYPVAAVNGSFDILNLPAGVYFASDGKTPVRLVKR